MDTAGQQAAFDASKRKSYVFVALFGICLVALLLLVANWFQPRVSPHPGDAEH